MAVEKKFTELPVASPPSLSDIICSVQGYVSPSNLGISVQQTLQQIYSLFQSNFVLFNAGNPNGVVAGNTYQLCWDTTGSALYICTTSGTGLTAVWTLVSTSMSSLVPPSLGGTGVANPTAHTLPVAEGASNFNFLGPLMDGQLLIGSNGLDPVPATLTAGTGISISNGAGTITVSGTASSIGWTEVTGTSQAMVADNGYIPNNVGLVTLTLPVTAAVGTVIRVVGKGAGGWRVAQNTGQRMQCGTTTTSTGAGGSVSSAAGTDSASWVCITADTVWSFVNPPQSTGLTIV